MPIIFCLTLMYDIILLYYIIFLFFYYYIILIKTGEKMALEFIEKQYKHSDCNELNAELDSFISDLSFQSEGLTERFMDIVLDHKNQREKEFSELYDAPLDWLESKLIQTQREVFDSIIDELNKIVYTEKPKRQPNMNSTVSREWLIDNVKPLILNGTVAQKEISEKMGIDPNNGTMTKRVKRAYGCDWEHYVDGVRHGRY